MIKHIQRSQRWHGFALKSFFRESLNHLMAPPSIEPGEGSRRRMELLCCWRAMGERTDRNKRDGEEAGGVTAGEKIHRAALRTGIRKWMVITSMPATVIKDSVSDAMIGPKEEASDSNPWENVGHNDRLWSRWRQWLHHFSEQRVWEELPLPFDAFGGICANWITSIETFLCTRSWTQPSLTSNTKLRYCSDSCNFVWWSVVDRSGRGLNKMRFLDENPCRLKKTGPNIEPWGTPQLCNNTFQLWDSIPEQRRIQCVDPPRTNLSQIDLHICDAASFACSRAALSLAAEIS